MLTGGNNVTSLGWADRRDLAGEITNETLDVHPVLHQVDIDLCPDVRVGLVVELCK